MIISDRGERQPLATTASMKHADAKIKKFISPTPDIKLPTRFFVFFWTCLPRLA